MRDGGYRVVVRLLGEDEGALAHLYGSDELDFPGSHHWDLVRDPKIRAAIADWLGVRAA
jgi:hypothetical protein